jgi:tyrosine-protein phosphatase YwqE
MASIIVMFANGRDSKNFEAEIQETTTALEAINGLATAKFIESGRNYVLMHPEKNTALRPDAVLVKNGVRSGSVVQVTEANIGAGS